MRFIFLCLLLISQSALAQINQLLLDSFMQAQVKYNRFNGNVLLAKDGAVVYRKAFGYRNFDKKEPLDNNTLFELGSVSKQFTAMGILILEKQGKLKLTDTLRKFFPQLPYQNITIRNMLNHTSGLPYYESLIDSLWDRNRIAFNKDIIRLLADHQPPPLFSPGARYTYSNTAYALLASIIEQVSGMSYGDFLKKHVFTPLGMNRSRTYNTRRSRGEVIPNYAYGYVYIDSSKRFHLPDSLPQFGFVYYMDGIQGDGIVNSTTGDLLKWDRALKEGKLLSPAVQKEMLSPQAISDSVSGKTYGYGVSISSDKLGTLIGHGGSWPGYLNYMARLAEDDLTVIVLSNTESDSPTVAELLLQLAKGERVSFPYEHKEVAIDPALLDRYAGQYQVGKSKLTLVRVADHLVWRRASWADIVVKPESDTKLFFTGNNDRQVEFELSADGEIAKVWLIRGGIRQEIKKIK